MTTPDEPRDPANSPSDTGWPVHADGAPPPIETSDPTDAEEEGWPTLPDAEPEPELETDPHEASEEVSVEDAPVFGRDEAPEPEPEPEPEPDLPAASEEVSVEDAPAFGRDEAPEATAAFAPEPEPEPEPESVVEPEPEPEPESEPEPELEPVVEAEAVDELTEVVEPAVTPAFPVDAALRRRRWMSAPLVALVLTTLLMAIATGFVWYRVHANSTTDSARRAGLDASRDAARVLFSYDYRQLDKDFAAGKALTTGAFRKQYGETTAKVVTPVAVEKKAVVKAEVVTAGVVRADAKTVVTIVYVNQVTTSSLAQAPKVDLSRVRMTLTKVDGHWLVSKVDAL